MYAALDTENRNGHRAGLGQIGPTTFTIGPGGQYSLSTASNASATSINDQLTNWLGQTTFGFPNSLFAVAAGGLLLIALFKRRR